LRGWFGDLTGHDDGVEEVWSNLGGNGAAFESDGLCMGHAACGELLVLCKKALQVSWRRLTGGAFAGATTAGANFDGSSAQNQPMAAVELRICEVIQGGEEGCVKGSEGSVVVCR